MSSLRLQSTALVLVATAAHAASPPPLPRLDDLAAKFGARPNAESIALSPSGEAVAVVTPIEGTRSTGVVLDIATGTTRRIVGDQGSEFRLRRCEWKSDERLLCTITATFRNYGHLLGTGRMVVISSAGKQVGQKFWSRRSLVELRGSVIDLLPDDPTHILMPGRKVDVTSGAITRSEPSRSDAIKYITDNHGHVHVLMIGSSDSFGIYNHSAYYISRASDKAAWKLLLSTDLSDNAAPEVLGLDQDGTRALILAPKDGRMALFKLSIDGYGAQELLLANSEVDVDGVLRIGKYNRPVAATYVLDKREYVFLDPVLDRLNHSLARALPKRPDVRIVDESWDGRKLLVFAAADDDPSAFYRYDVERHRLEMLFEVRPALAGSKLSQVQAVRYVAADGTQVPAFLTLPPGRTDLRGLPAIVMPHGGPAARDALGFDWLPQFFAASGYAVIQPNFRGSAGYGEKWLVQNGFKGWKTAIQDINDGARWMIAQGADRSKLAIFGWSYGGYAALQANVLDPNLYRATIAVAPVTDLTLLRTEAEGFTNERLTREFLGESANLVAGSPAKNASRIKTPVLIFQGDKDLNVDMAQAKRMDAALAHAGKSHQLVMYPGLDHQLADGDARADMLRRSAAFLAEDLGITPALADASKPK